MTITFVKPSDQDLSQQERSLLDLYRFQSMPHAIGIDNVREDLRNTVRLMMELKGYSTGLQLAHLTSNEHSSLAPEGTLKGDAKRKRKKRDWQDHFNRLMADLKKQFTVIFAAVKETVSDLKQLFDAEIEHIEDEIENLIEAVEESSTDKEKSTVLKAAISKKKQRLKKFFKMKEHVEAHETVLDKVGQKEDVSKVIDIQQTLTEDVHNFYHHDVIPKTAPKKSIYAGMYTFDQVGQEFINSPPSNDDYDLLEDAAFDDDDETPDNDKSTSDRVKNKNTLPEIDNYDL